MHNNPEQMIPARSVIRLLEESAAAAGCLTFGLRMAELRGIADLGMVSLLIAHQTTLRDALSVLTQFRNRINTNLALRIEEYDEMVMLRENFVFDPQSLRGRPTTWRLAFWSKCADRFSAAIGNRSLFAFPMSGHRSRRCGSSSGCSPARLSSGQSLKEFF